MYEESFYEDVWEIFKVQKNLINSKAINKMITQVAGAAAALAYRYTAGVNFSKV